ncbi:hypothetical protein ELY33_15525 [Vreelandella andesensis]|uniref:ATPase n=1 Tax=Vreelandella andesensis TaxID=447567 RepID=A0A3S0Y0X6_9GAMM|nr:hypothetical protein [Halomonas andesensis]RUR27309.1 hypothetical protein ELY33_15525 [Halomonas andesensis]
MTVETIQDVLELTRKLHTDLADVFEHASQASHQERLRMLFDYLSKHERELSQVVALTITSGRPGVLDTWCAEYFDKHSFTFEQLNTTNYLQMNSEEVMHSLLLIHNQLIDLYRYLSSRAETSAVEELLNGVLALEQHEIMRMMRDAEELEDL